MDDAGTKTKEVAAGVCFHRLSGCAVNSGAQSATFTRHHRGIISSM